MRRKTKNTYDKLWADIYNQLDGKDIRWQSAHFDFEPAAINSFKKYFDVPCKMCCFHVKSALDRKVSSKSTKLYKAYRKKKNVQKIVRMIGAQQFLPERLVKKSHKLIKKIISWIFIINFIQKISR